MRFQSQTLTPDRSARHFFGGELRRHRETADLSLVQLARIVNSSKSTLARVETAELMPPPDLPSRLDLAFGLDGFFERLHRLARREAHPDQYRRYMDFEAEATDMEHFAGHLVPGVFQVEAYARAFFRCDEEITEEQVNALVAARMGRQERLHGPNPPHVWAILDEAVVRRPVGGRDIMARQLSQLIKLADTAHTKVQVLPFVHGGHALMNGATTLLRLPDGREVAYEEGRKNGYLYEEQEEVRRHRRQYDVLKAYALTPAETAGLIQSVLEEHQACDSSST